MRDRRNAELLRADQVDSLGVNRWLLERIAHGLSDPLTSARRIQGQRQLEAVETADSKAVIEPFNCGGLVSIASDEHHQRVQALADEIPLRRRR